MKFPTPLGVWFSVAATALLVIASFVPLPAVITSACTVGHIGCAAFGLFMGIRGLFQRQWPALIPVLLCAFFLWVQWYWFYEWIS
jgi:hypothetical protein